MKTAAPGDGMRPFDGTGMTKSSAMSMAVNSGEASCSQPLDDPSPDALKNTPSNIARLEDIIDQCEARQKYLAQTKSPSDGEDVRWYFCKVPLAPNELAASAPVTEIVGKSEYFRFSLRDSLAIEASFLQREEEYLSAWWKEYAECSIGPSGSGKRSATTHGIEPKSADESMQKLLESGSGSTPSSGEIYADAEETVGVPVKGGLYEVDLSKRYCFPVYWHGEHRRVLRGQWFARKGGLEWLPLREDVAEQLEFAYRSRVWHRRTFQLSGQFAARVDLQGETQGLHALFMGEDGNWEAWLGVDASGISLVIGARGNGIKLRRGFAPSGSPQPTQDELRQRKEEEMDDYCSQVPVRHLVFMVHGIGQRLEKANLVDDVATFRQIVAGLAEQHLTTYQRNTQRVLFIPCQWRRSLKLGGEAAVEKITLEGVRALRTMLSATVHDVLYYMSPIYCQDIIDSVSNQLNSLYLKFLKRNPGYDGKVSIYGHSLGSVLSYDILCHQQNLSSFFPIEHINQGAVYNDEPLDRRDYSGNVPDGSPVIYEEKGNADVSENSPKKARAESKQAMETVYGQKADIVDSKWNSEILDAQQKITLESKQEEGIGINLQEVTFGPKQQEERASASEDITVEPIPETEIVNDGAGHLQGTENAISENCNEVIESLRKEVMTLKEKIRELEQRQRENEFTVGTVTDPGPPFYSRETSEGVSGDFTLNLDSLLSKNFGGDTVCNAQGEKELNLGTFKSGSVKDNTVTRVESVKHYTPYVRYTKLEFKVDTFFAVGSPLGVFLSLRNVRIGAGNGKDYWQDESITEEIPDCQQMLNIFHPYDPVAYRLEPLICKEDVHKRPVFIPYHKGGKRLHIGMQEFSEDMSARTKAFMKRLNSARGRMVNAFGARGGYKNEDEEDDTRNRPVRTYGLTMMEQLTGSLDGRIDYMLQDSTFEHPYISAISSHTSYWRDLDTALFILKHLYREIPPDPPEGIKAKQKGSSITLNDNIDSLDDEMTLTFSSMKAIKALSSFNKGSKAIAKT